MQFIIVMVSLYLFCLKCFIHFQLSLLLLPPTQMFIIWPFLHKSYSFLFLVILLHSIAFVLLFLSSIIFLLRYLNVTFFLFHIYFYFLVPPMWLMYKIFYFTITKCLYNIWALLPNVLIYSSKCYIFPDVLLVLLCYFF